jgi:23S rRNA pseudouridine1911/1915/1917 synthase
VSERLQTDAPAPLLAFLAARLSGWSKNTLRQRLALGCVRVNGTVVKRGDHLLAAGDEVTVAARDGAERPVESARFGTLFVDEELVAIDKPEGLLSVASEREHAQTALALVRAALARPGKRVELWPVHRLDRETSGVLLFARTRAACDAVQAAWGEVRKTYLALVSGAPRPAEGVIELPLAERRDLDVRVVHGPEGKPARTRYRTREVRGGFALLEVELDTGRRHQIRVHLAALGHPVVGDERYGTRAARLGLHAWKLALTHPSTGIRLELEAPPPPSFRALS